MIHEVRFISPQRLARIMAAIVGGILLLVSLLMLPIFLFAPFPENVPNQPPKALFFVLILLYPLFGALWGWISGQVTARIYNFVSARLGGMLLDLAPVNQASQ